MLLLLLLLPTFVCAKSKLGLDSLIIDVVIIVATVCIIIISSMLCLSSLSSLSHFAQTEINFPTRKYICVCVYVLKF